MNLDWHQRGELASLLIGLGVWGLIFWSFRPFYGWRQIKRRIAWAEREAEKRLK